MSYRFGASTYAISCREVTASKTVRFVVDGAETVDDTLTLTNDGRAHEVLVNLARLP